MSESKRPKSKPFHCKKRHPIDQIREVRQAFQQQLPALKKDFEEDITCIGAFLKGSMECINADGLPHTFWAGEGQRFTHAYYRLFFSNPELFPDQTEHPSDFDAWTTYESLTNPKFDPMANQGLLELINLRSAFEVYKYQGRSINALIQDAEEKGQYEALEEAINHMARDYFRAQKSS